jgi:hypothetical protein
MCHLSLIDLIVNALEYSSIGELQSSLCTSEVKSDVRAGCDNYYMQNN